MFHSRFYDVDKRIAALEAQVRALTEALREEREHRDSLHLRLNGFESFERCLLDHFNLKFETVPRSTRLVKR